MILTEGDLLKAIEDAVLHAREAIPDGPPGLTTSEMAESLDIPADRVGKMLSRAVKRGELVAERGIRKNILGEVYRPPVYRPVAHE